MMSSSSAGSSSSFSGSIHNRQYGSGGSTLPRTTGSNGNSGLAEGTEGTNEVDPEVDDYFCALLAQSAWISEDRERGQLGKLGADSDTQMAIEYMLREALELEQSYRLAKSLANCEPLPEEVIDELNEEDDQSRADHELAGRLERQEPDAEVAVQATTARFQLVLQHFNVTATCVACDSAKQTYIAPCDHPYCEECARSLCLHALSNKSFIPVRCCREHFANEVVAACLPNRNDVERYEAIKQEIEHPCPPAEELDAAASRVITENGWKVCFRCGAVVEKVSGCVHITCTCRNEFCYTCLKPWKTCTCELYPVEELNRILNDRVGPDAPGIVRHRLQHVLRNYYHHNHEWERQRSYGQVCNVCRWSMPLYAMHCATCMETRCQRCSHNG